MREGITSSVECSCREPRLEVSDALLEVFARVRSRCAALGQILVPDALWSDFQEWHARTDEEARHRSALLLALKRGHLERITSPIHTYLLADGRPREDLRKQYLQDLGERWFNYADPLERHRKSRIFFGRLVELQCAEWLEALGWEIAGLEALREGPDIEARRQRGQLTAFEVKFIGMDDVDFEVVRMSLKGESAGAAVSLYSATNYLLFRAYEAAKQLQEVKHARVALLVVDDQPPDRFEYGWIDWNDPRFFQGDQSWQEFLKRQRHQYPTLESDLRPTLHSVNAVWIVKLSSGYKYDREYEKVIRAA